MLDILKIVIVLLVLDLIFIKLMSGKFNKTILDVQKSEPKLRAFPAIICYIALVFGLYYFIIRTNETRENKIKNAFLLGLVIYTVFETTNYTFLDKWSPEVVIIDSLWGGILFALTTFLVTLKF